MTFAVHLIRKTGYAAQSFSVLCLTGTYGSRRRRLSAAPDLAFAGSEVAPGTAASSFSSPRNGACGSARGAGPSWSLSHQGRLRFAGGSFDILHHLSRSSDC